jgi:hypothetical protein
MPYAVLFLLFAVVMIAAYFYLMRAKARDDARRASTEAESGDRISPVFE